MSTATITREIIVAPFGVEADHPRNCDLLLQCIPNARIRSAFDGSKPHKDVKTGQYKVPIDQAIALAAFPKVPGMQVHVNPLKCEYKIIDPLTKNEALCEQIRQFMSQNQAFRTKDKIGGVPTREGTLDIHQMKSLCRELFNIVNSGEGRIVMGSMPEKEEIDDLPGWYLLNPGSQVPNTQPRYEKDMANFVMGISASGG